MSHIRLLQFYLFILGTNIIDGEILFHSSPEHDALSSH